MAEIRARTGKTIKDMICLGAISKSGRPDLELLNTLCPNFRKAGV
jgi:hypothetical protein